jgi:hypothetical protein
MAMADLKTLSNEVAETIGGGDCTLSDVVKLSNELTKAYENLIEFSSYVIERVAGQ